MLFIRKYKQLLKFVIIFRLNYYRHYQVFKEHYLRNQMISQNQVKWAKLVDFQELLMLRILAPKFLYGYFSIFCNFLLHRKEVIHPHVLVGIPCYDFTPVTCPTLDGPLPCGLGYRLQVLQTPMA